jgi:hypothetical protein
VWLLGIRVLWWPLFMEHDAVEPNPAMEPTAHFWKRQERAAAEAQRSPDGNVPIVTAMPHHCRHGAERELIP